MVQDGRVMGLSVQAVAIVQHDDHTLVDVVLAEGAEPNMEAIPKGNAVIEHLLAEGQVTRFRLPPRSPWRSSHRMSHHMGTGHSAYDLQHRLPNQFSRVKDIVSKMACFV